ncbi:MAG: GGDEF domain-containing protein [Gammaproteobacteria bacterium]|nr:GGDEF domain-containing protein [Gammaproteobacteria bacterium]MDH5591985.1 GGDEF domain-containing protein [Gammaproteobacteria bacterium]
MTTESDTTAPENTQADQQALVSIEVLEKIVNKLLVHKEHNALTTGFIELIDDWFQPKKIQLFSSGLRGMLAHRGQKISEVIVSDLLSSDSDSVSFPLSDDQLVLTTVDSQEVQLFTWHQLNCVDVYVPIMLGKVVGSVLVIKSISSDSVNRRVWEQMLAAFTHLNRLLYTSEIDALTGLMNRMAFDRLMDQAVTDKSKSISDEIATYFVLIDIDHFKKINDSFGHLYGDEVLILLARSMSESFRSMDWLFRYGGEEFAVMLHDVEHDEAYQVLERFRDKVESTNFPLVGRVTVSIGYSRMAEVQSDSSFLEPVSSLIDRADHALYYAKNNGRNRVLCYEDLLEQGLLIPAEQETGDVELF